MLSTPFYVFFLTFLLASLEQLTKLYAVFFYTHRVVFLKQTIYHV